MKNSSSDVYHVHCEISHNFILFFFVVMIDLVREEGGDGVLGLQVLLAR